MMFFDFLGYQIGLHISIEPSSIGANSDGRRQVLGMQLGASEAKPFWTEFLRSLARRGLRGVKLVISDAHEGLMAAVRKVMSASWQRCRVHFMRNLLVHAPTGQRRVVSALVATMFAQTAEPAARAQWRTVAEQLRERFPKISRLMDEAEDNVLAHMSFPREHRCKIHSINPLERPNGQIKRRTDVVGPSPTKRPSTACSARCYCNRMTSGHCSAAT